MAMFASVRASAAEKSTARPGDGLVAPADVIMDRAFTVDARRARSGPGYSSWASAGPGGI